MFLFSTLHFLSLKFVFLFVMHAYPVHTHALFPQLEEDNSDAMIVFLSDVWLDKVKVSIARSQGQRASGQGHCTLELRSASVCRGVKISVS